MPAADDNACTHLPRFSEGLSECSLKLPSTWNCNLACQAHQPLHTTVLLAGVWQQCCTNVFADAEPHLRYPAHFIVI